MPGAGILAYNAALPPEDQALCANLAARLDEGLPGATSKVWHAHPVWFLGANPIVGYSNRKAGITLMFWSGQSFATPGLVPEGKFKAAQIVLSSPDDLAGGRLEAWLEESRRVQWDYANIVRHKGRLDRLEVPAT